VPRRGERNEPAFVAHTAQVLAELKGLDARTFADLTSRNAERLFSKLPPRAAEAA
jgi:TatD DNase family protein